MHRSTTSPSKVGLLKGLPPFRNLPDRELAPIANLLTETSVGPGTVLTHEGRPGREAFLIVSGTADVLVNGRRVGKLGPGELAGEMAMLDRRPRSATVVATTAMHLLTVGPQEFHDLATKPSVARAITMAFCVRLRDVDDRAALLLGSQIA